MCLCNVHNLPILQETRALGVLNVMDRTRFLKVSMLFDRAPVRTGGIHHQSNAARLRGQTWYTLHEAGSEFRSGGRWAEEFSPQVAEQPHQNGPPVRLHGGRYFIGM